MLFVELRFLIFFAIIFVVHWTLPHRTLRKVWLLICSYAFYAAWDWRFLALILASTVIDYLVGRGLERASRNTSRRALLLTSLFGNLGILGFFKYWNFFAQSGGELFSWLGIPYQPRIFESLVLPVGISFYTFQTLSYSIDVYRRKIEPTRNFLDLALFVAFFPQLVAGPIVRAADFLPQLRRSPVFARIEFRGLLLLFLVGFFKKACISDNLAPMVDAYFANPGAYTALSAWLGTLFFAVQVYCDFSGYSDMAIACAGMLGYQLCKNFDFPYLAPNITSLWRRWHISLSSWLRDYVYIPFGGSQGSRWATHRNILLTMVLGGLWHGARWNYVIWGALNGIALIMHKEWTHVRPKREGPGWWATALGTVLTFWWFCVGLIFFRTSGEPPTPFSVDLERAWTGFEAFVFFDSPGARELPGSLWWVLALAIAHVLARKNVFSRMWVRLPDWAFALAYGFAFSLILPFVPTKYTPFFYFQF